MHFLNKVVVAAIPLVPRRMVRFFASRYIAGETLADAVKTVRQLNAEHVCATLDVLGEDVFTREESIASKNKSIEVLQAISNERLDSNLSIKLTSLGLKLDRSFCEENVRSILDVAQSLDNFVRIDMEDHTCTSETIAVYQSVAKDYKKVGIVLQAYLRRTAADTSSLAGERANFRLCKGIYREPEDIAYKGRAEVQQKYLGLLRTMFETKSYVGIATHDSVLVDGALKILREMKLSREQYEFQMLLGVRPELRRKLLNDGHKVRLYVPFGEHWYGYSTRRFKENPEVAGYVFRSLLRFNH